MLPSTAFPANPNIIINEKMDIYISVSMNKLSGDNQQGTISTTLTQPLIVKATYANGRPVSGLPISFTISMQPQGASGAKLSAISAITNTNGQAQTTLILGDKTGIYQVTASNPNLINLPLVFTAIGDNWKTYNYTWESDHDYQNNFTNTWIISHPGASKMQVHFEKYNIVSSDKLFVLDKNNKGLISYSGSMNDVLSPIVVGDVIKLKLVTDSRDTAYGFKVDRYMASDGSPLPQDTTPPAGITNLDISNATPISIKLAWTAPGDDGNIGQAMFYDIRYSTSPINDSNWANAAQVQGEPVPAKAWTNQDVVVSGLSENSVYYFGIKSYDDRGVVSILSNIAKGTTPPAGCSLINGGVDLNTGIANTTQFTYSVTYTDSNNQAPKTGYPKIHILLGEREVRNGLMSPVEFMDITYTDGKAYQYKSMLPYSGKYTFWFEVFNKNNESARTEVYQGPTVSGVNIAPELAWTGEPGYEANGIDPDGVGLGKECVYKVKYTDANNDPIANGYPRVYIYNPLGQLIGSTVMKYESGSWSTGAIYRLSTATFSAAGRYSYRFEARDSVGVTAIGAPMATKEGPTVSGAPVLSWIGDHGYEKDGINPEFGLAKETMFIYQVRYADPDGDKPYPGYPKLRIYKGGVELAGESPKTMTKVTSGETEDVYKGGVIYKVEYKLPVGGSDYTYKFEAMDRWGVPAIGEPASRLMDNPDISTPPVLEWSNINDGYIQDGVEPNSGQHGESFVFTVKYSDYDNDAPASGYPKVFLYRDNVKVGSLVLSGSGTRYSKGVVFSTTTTLLNRGTYSYRFEAMDVKGVPATGNPVKEQIGPVVYTVPVLSWLGISGYESDGVSPNDGTNETLFTFKVKYTGMIPPAANSPKVIITSTGGEIIEGKMSGTGTGYADGVGFSYSTTLSGKGRYSYSFCAEDTTGMIATGIPVQIMSGPIVTIDTTSPSQIATLDISNPQVGSITLTWTAPGDDGNSGTATEYDIRYATVTITEASWNNALQCVNEPAPKVAGTGQSFVITGLQPYTRYYVAMKTRDEQRNWSGISNVAVGTTTVLINVIQVTPPNGSVSFTTQTGENNIRCIADIKPDSLDATYNAQIEWEIDDNPNDGNPSGDPADPQRGNDVNLQITAPASPNGRPFPLSYRIRAFVAINNATYTSVASYTTQDNLDGLRQEYIDIQVPSRSPIRVSFDQATPAYPRLLDRRPGHVDVCLWHQWWILQNLNQHARNLDNAYSGNLFPTCGYRCPVQNYILVLQGLAALNSNHQYGRALDFDQGSSQENYNVWVSAGQTGATERYLRGSNKINYGLPGQPTPTWPAPAGVIYERGHAAW